ncbi:MAG TPA: hypothetical protein VFY27_09445, partial [Woeseiaceae bacterium]|nr:hypothetical protein [Woeseiaceae bacterium]
MKLLISCSAAALLFLSGCDRGEETPTPQPAEPVAAQQQEEDASAELNALVEEFFERQLELNPLYATAIGDLRFNDRMANQIGPEHREATAALNREYLERVLALDPEILQGQDRLTYETFRYDREMELEELE